MTIIFLQKLLEDYIGEVKARIRWKNELRRKNEDVENRPEESDFHKLDSSLKKNTAFVRKLVAFPRAIVDFYTVDFFPPFRKTTRTPKRT